MRPWVFETEPHINKRFLSLDNVVLTPHLGAMTEEADKRMCMDAAKEVISFFKYDSKTNIYSGTQKTVCQKQKRLIRQD